MNNDDKKPENQQTPEGVEATVDSSEQMPVSEAGLSSDQTINTDLESEFANISPEALLEENTQLKDKLVRTLADMENLRARTEREKNDMAKYAIANFARDMLSIGDNITRAIDAVPADAVEADPALKTLLDGVEMTRRELTNSMERHGVNQIAAKGEPFDPNLHQAMFEVPNPEVNAGLVVEVVQEGYVIGDRVLRPAGVGVSKGGAKLPKEAPAETDPAPQAQAEQAHPERPQEASTDQPQPAEAPSTTDPRMGENLDKSA